MIDEVHHYCSPPVFLSLIRNKELWLTSLTLSNDHSEGTWMLNNWLEKFSHRIVKERLQRSGAKIAVEDVLRQNVALGTCFSEERDLLSQWRGYAQDGAGFSVSFDKQKLEQFARDFEGVSLLNFKKISYGNQDWEEVNDVIKALHGAFGEDAAKYEEGNGIGTMSLSFTPEKHQRQKEIAGDLFAIKNGAFKEEKEWRLFLFDSIDNIKNIEFRESRGLLSPFVRIKVPPDSIVGVTVGPTNPTPVSMVEAMLKKNEVEGPVSRSHASYRTR